MMLCYKELDRDYWNNWHAKYKRDNKEMSFEEKTNLVNELESNLILLGATALED